MRQTGEQIPRQETLLELLERRGWVEIPTGSLVALPVVLVETGRAVLALGLAAAAILAPAIADAILRAVGWRRIERSIRRPR